MPAVKKHSKKSERESGGALERVRSLPWTAMAQGGLVVGRRWIALSASERARLTELLRESRGRVGSLTEKERRELRKIVQRLDLKGMTAELVALRRVSARRRRRRG